MKLWPVYKDVLLTCLNRGAAIQLQWIKEGGELGPMKDSYKYSSEFFRQPYINIGRIEK